MEAGYWKNRLFRNTYTHEGRRFETNHWSVKIQHLGERRTFSLRAQDSERAATEACQLYKAIIREGLNGPAMPRRHTVAGTKIQPAGRIAGETDQSDAGYWIERLIHRPYAMGLPTSASQELSVRIEHEGISHYFPLGTEDPRIAANQALSIHQTTVGQGWAAAKRQFNRELTVGFRWIDNPLAWTYTTIHTGRPIPTGRINRGSAPPAGKTGVAIIEPDAGVRQSLAWCLDQMEGFYCAAAFNSAFRAMAELRRRSFPLMLVSLSLADGPGLTQLNEWKTRGTETASLRYSIYPDSEELFAATPGGAVCYLLRRRPPAEFLEPIHNVSTSEGLSNQELAARAWQYFKNIFALRPSSGPGQVSTNLTQREHEVLALLSHGHPDKEIASRLNISIYTVHEHVRNIFEKLGVHNRTGAVVKYLQK